MSECLVSAWLSPARVFFSSPTFSSRANLPHLTQGGPCRHHPGCQLTAVHVCKGDGGLRHAKGQGELPPGTFGLLLVCFLFLLVRSLRQGGPAVVEPPVSETPPVKRDFLEWVVIARSGGVVLVQRGGKRNRADIQIREAPGS